MNFRMPICKRDSPRAVVVASREIHQLGRCTSIHIDEKVTVIDAVVPLIDKNQCLRWARDRHVGAFTVELVTRGGRSRILPSHPTAHGHRPHDREHGIAFFRHDSTGDAMVNSRCLDVGPDRRELSLGQQKRVGVVLVVWLAWVQPAGNPVSSLVRDFFRPNVAWDKIVMIGAVHDPGQLQLLQTAHAMDALGLRFRLAERGQQHASEDRDDGNDHEKLDQCKAGRAAGIPGRAIPARRGVFADIHKNSSGSGVIWFESNSSSDSLVPSILNTGLPRQNSPVWASTSLMISAIISLTTCAVLSRLLSYYLGSIEALSI
jgi:hypothetical protein